MRQEQQYLDLLLTILERGEDRDDRTGVGTRGIFGTSMRFDLRERFPLLTTKKMAWRSIVEELLWFIRGDTNSKHLEQKKVPIWKGNSTREFLDKKGLKYPEGFIGPGYGWQWRHWGARYGICEKEVKRGDSDRWQHCYYDKGQKILDTESYKNQPVVDQGIDQLQRVVTALRENPTSRQDLIVSAWNVSQLHEMALPPCHLLFQFWVSKEEGTLSCQMYQRSCDMFLGVPFNIASYSLLTCLMAAITGYKPGEFIWIGGDTHIYKNHVTQVLEQTRREPYRFPQIILPKLSSLEDIEALSFDDIELIDYKSHPPIKADMAV